MSDYLEHGKFKYIDKWKSKTGKWVYKYAEDAKKKAQKLNDKYGPKVTKTVTAGGRARNYPQSGYDQKTTTIKKNLIGGKTVSKSTAYDRSGKPSAPKLTTSKRDPMRTVWEKTHTGTKKGKREAFVGNDQQRYAMYKIKGRTLFDPVETYGIRTEYRDSSWDAERTRKYSMRNAASRGNKFIKKLGALNDKYGPKFTETTTQTLGTGRVYVDTYIRNLIGGKKVRVESYSYDLFD